VRIFWFLTFCLLFFEIFLNQLLFVTSVAFFRVIRFGLLFFFGNIVRSMIMFESCNDGVLGVSRVDEFSGFTSISDLPHCCLIFVLSFLVI